MWPSNLGHRYAIDDAQFHRELSVLLGPPIIDGNRVSNLENGIEIFPAMLQAVRAARNNVNFETYIYWSGEVGQEFADAHSSNTRRPCCRPSSDARHAAMQGNRICAKAYGTHAQPRLSSASLVESAKELR